MSDASLRDFAVDGAEEYARKRASALSRAHSSALVDSADGIQQRTDSGRAMSQMKKELAASRSTAFEQTQTSAPRNESLELVTHLERGPLRHTPLPDDPSFNTLEPNANVRLADRRIPHEDVQRYLDCRYAVVPNVLYSLVRDMPLAMDGDLEVPLYGDWVLFGVLGEKGGMRYTKAADDGDTVKPARKFFSCKLFDLGAHAATGDGGDHVVHMLVFDGDDGAFDRLWKEHDGTLVAVLNPRFLKQQNKSKVLTITPRSAAAVLAIGRAADYAQCGATKKDGSRCTAFVSKRGMGVCEFHLERAVVHRQRGRMEFAAGTTSVLGRPGRDKGRAQMTPGLHGLAAGSGRTFHFASEPVVPSDPRSAAFDVDARYGRGRAEKEQRKRKRAEQEQSVQNLPGGAALCASAEASAKSKPKPKSTAAPQDAAALHVNADARALSDIDPHSVAAHALRTAQDTLDAKRNKAVHKEAPKATQGAAARLLARRDAQLKAGRLGARAASTTNRDSDSDDDLIITRD
ncbi:hypothetical protein MCUN1_003866 [Malassezia cuniculi]|uniref:Zinc finger Mcm10/DnaG-type domain-containing protein n=1 Tax=Malassezia cuniculi TaxID=948313 RepID=A0AAF0J8L4_9BASI|nr:hypothetical protein MCUN1_003866 [Malassezia cuniculi]